MQPRVRRDLQSRATNIRLGPHNDVTPWRLLTQARREPCLPGKVRKLPEVMARGHGGDVSRRAIEAKNGPLIADRSIAIEGHEPHASGRTEIQFQSIEIVREASSQRFHDRLFLRP